MLTIVIGAGPSGLCAAFSSANDNNQVIVIEKNNKVGKKLFITGKGRCNVTNNCSNQQFIDNVVNNKQFLYSSISNFNPSDTISLFNELNVELITERGNRVFPKSNHAYDISDALKRKCISSGVKFHLNEEVISIEKEDEHFILKTNRNIYYPDFVVIATGGKSYPLTGSTGDGYRFASSFNHQIIEPVPGLVGLKIKEEVNNNLNGFTLKNVTLTAKYSDKKISEFGELTFYQNYLDGAISITISSLINRIKEPIQLEIDLKPALSENQLINRINKEINEHPLEPISKIIKGMTSSRFYDFFVNKIDFDVNDKCIYFSNEKKFKLINLLKHFPLTYLGLMGFDRAIITSGGISTKQINAKTMESKIVPSLFFVGEVIDVDAFTGGFNIQIAISTGIAAGKYINQITNYL